MYLKIGSPNSRVVVWNPLQFLRTYKLWYVTLYFYQGEKLSSVHKHHKGKITQQFWDEKTKYTSDIQVNSTLRHLHFVCVSMCTGQLVLLALTGSDHTWEMSDGLLELINNLLTSCWISESCKPAVCHMYQSKVSMLDILNCPKYHSVCCTSS